MYIKAARLRLDVLYGFADEVLCDYDMENTS